MSKTNYSIEEISAYIEQAYQDWNIPGGLAAVIKDGEFVLSKGFGVCDKGNPEPIKPDTVFSIGSCTKAFTAAALGLLVDEGKLNWDDRVIQYLPGFAMVDPWVTEHVTIRDLVNHKLGLQRWNRIMLQGEKFDPDQFIEKIRYIQPNKDFRTRFHYGNEQYIVAGKIIEVISGMSYADFMQKRIFDPLEMSSTYINLQQMLANHKGAIARGHYNHDDKLMPVELRFFDEQKPADFWELGTNAAGSIWSTMDDIKNWIDLFLAKGDFKGKRIFSSELFEELTTPQFNILPQDSVIAELMPLELGIDFQTYAFGWVVMSFHGKKLIVHGGNTVDGNTTIGFIPSENLGFSTFINTYSGIIHILVALFLVDAILFNDWNDYSQKGLELAKSWISGLQPMLDAFETSRKQSSAPSLPLEKYAGEYESPLMGTVHIRWESGKLVYDYSSEQQADLSHWEDDTFRMRYHKPYWGTEFVIFEANQQGVIAFVLRDLEGNDVQRLVKR